MFRFELTADSSMYSNGIWYKKGLVFVVYIEQTVGLEIFRIIVILYAETFEFGIKHSRYINQ